MNFLNVGLNIYTHFFELKWLGFIPNTMQIITLFHHTLFIIYKRLLSNTRRSLEGPSR